MNFDFRDKVLSSIQNHTLIELEHLDNINHTNFKSELLDKLEVEFEACFDATLKDLSDDEQNFLLDIYSYGDLYDFDVDYIDRVVKEGYAVLNHLSHIPKNFEYDLYEKYQNIFDDTLKASDISKAVNEKFIELNQYVMDNFSVRNADIVESTFDLFFANSDEILKANAKKHRR